ncbi:hypothetical protein CHS0354_002282 [Potamilus streckersoni]|uniref:Uncharacterized protein n=1 Tax=Potamilus streckersoni TaxID=2493646 RepID=A0AAE0VP31_9BIVA|nr:hypothetical protein CHS0354_002282 [Potamilus streckersoni]
MQYFFVISSDKWIEFSLKPQGSVFESGDVKDVTATFPSGCVRKNCNIDIQVMCPNLVNHTENKNPDDVINIIGLSPRIWIKHDEIPSFQKPVVVTLPLPSTSTEHDAGLLVIEWTEDDDVYITDANISLKNNVCKFEVNSFSG